ncbi:hypothetical protein Sjap_020723 [Stephania japonica]|uniref:Uncharacterized protein n=1 Tax=Stephania japonica TaxID=461633 RepID=A0AAP0I0W5_9MAGN
MGDRPVSEEAIVDTHINVLSEVIGSSDEATDSIVHSYTYSFSGFAAKLSTAEAKKLSRMEGVISVFPNRYHKVHTTKTWDFLGLPQTAARNMKGESNIVVGLIDTGISPGSKSFSDKGFGRPPVKWKGSCKKYANFTGCNNKIIGARYFKLDGDTDPADILSPVDVVGHGTHTSSTLAGNAVPGASLYGLAKGTARGAVPSTRVAMYKVCWASRGCSDMDILAAFDAAIKDGVDIISISIGGQGYPNYSADSIAIGAFHAMKGGVLTVASAGNDGPGIASLENFAPWIFTVGASGIDRLFKSKVVLGNGRQVSGIGINSFAPKKRFYPLVSGADAPKDSYNSVASRYCAENSLDPKIVQGKLVYCELQEWGVDSFVKEAGGIGAILAGEVASDDAQIFMAPATMVNYTVGQVVSDYINSTRTPSAVIYKSEEVHVSAPFVASFSSRGPSLASNNILKPDIVAPGIDILAAYTPLKSLTGLKGDTQYSKFSIMSGTSMACPHVAGVAAYIKSFYPSWSPAAIKSAIITTATPMSPKRNNDQEFAYGAGQVNPRRALHPGLVYDIDALGYLQFLCHDGYKNSVFGNCSGVAPAKGVDALNYPTMQLSLKSSRNSTVGVFRRRVTNVGPANSIYTPTITAPQGVQITVKPTSLNFTKTNQMKSFSVTVKANPLGDQQDLLMSASLEWRSSAGKYRVRSPIVIYNPNSLSIIR